MSEAKYESLLKIKKAVEESILHWKVELSRAEKKYNVALEIDNAFKTENQYSKDLDYENEPESEAPYRELFFKPLNNSGLYIENPDIKYLRGNIRRCTYSDCPITPKVYEALKENIDFANSEIFKYMDELEELNRKIRRCKWSVRKDKVFRFILKCFRVGIVLVVGTVFAVVIEYFLRDKGLLNKIFR